MTVLTLGTLASLPGCGHDESGARLYPGRVSGQVCDAKSGAAVAGAKVIVTSWVGSSFDETPSTVVTTADADGDFTLGTPLARHVWIEVGAPGHHPMGWVYGGESRYCLEPVTERAGLDVKRFRVGYRGGKPFGFNFARGQETDDPSVWDVGPTATRGFNDDAHFAFTGKGGVVMIPREPSAHGYSFERDFEPPADGYAPTFTRAWGSPGRAGFLWFFRDASGKRYGKASAVSAEDSGNDWSADFDYAINADGVRWVEPKWRDISPRWKPNPGLRWVYYGLLVIGVAAFLLIALIIRRPFKRRRERREREQVRARARAQ